jgi:hypothetical protein
VHVGGPRQRRLLATLLIHHEPRRLGLRPRRRRLRCVSPTACGGHPPHLRDQAAPGASRRPRRDGRAAGVRAADREPGRDRCRPFRVRARAGAAASRARRAGTAARAFTDALQLWRGRPFEEVADEPWAAPEVRRLEELEPRVGSVWSTRWWPMIAPPTRSRSSANWSQAEPFDETHRLRQARTFYRAGRANDALAALREFRGQLAEELGLDPSPELDVLEQAILRHDPGLGSARRVRGYLIGERLGRGASGPVHAAWSAASSTRLAIRIYPVGTGGRSQLRAFLRRRRATARGPVAPRPRADLRRLARTRGRLSGHGPAHRRDAHGPAASWSAGSRGAHACSRSGSSAPWQPPGRPGFDMVG